MVVWGTPGRSGDCATTVARAGMLSRRSNPPGPVPGYGGPARRRPRACHTGRGARCRADDPGSITSQTDEERTTFGDLELRAELLTALSGLGYEEPTPIQSEAIPPLLEGRDLLGEAATGTGKTAAFALPLLQRIAEGIGGNAPRALVLVPTLVVLLGRHGFWAGVLGRRGPVAGSVVASSPAQTSSRPGKIVQGLARPRTPWLFSRSGGCWA